MWPDRFKRSPIRRTDMKTRVNPCLYGPLREIGPGCRGRLATVVTRGDLRREARNGSSAQDHCGFRSATASTSSKNSGLTSAGMNTAVDVGL